MDDFGAMNGEYEKHFTHKPARSCVAVRQLPKGVPVEIECVALPGLLVERERGGCEMACSEEEWENTVRRMRGKGVGQAEKIVGQVRLEE